jgi:hypothetical protein
MSTKKKNIDMKSQHVDSVYISFLRLFYSNLPNFTVKYVAIRRIYRPSSYQNDSAFTTYALNRLRVNANASQNPSTA